MKKWVILFFLFFGCWTIIAVSGTISILEWINLSFMVGICGLVAAAILHIISSGFFSMFINGFRLIGQIIMPKSNAQKQADEIVAEDIEFQEFKSKLFQELVRFTLSIGSSSIIVSFIGLLFYY